MPRRKKPKLSSADRVWARLDFDLAIWQVGVGYSKGVFGGRGYSLRVTHLPSGREKSGFFRVWGKAEARRAAAEKAKDWMTELS